MQRRKPKGIKQGWYPLKNPSKFRLPLDTHMKSFKSNHVNFKSGLELKAFKYCDLNPKVKEWSLEPFAIGYISPKDSRQHRYYPDLWIRFVNDSVFVVEVKSSSEVKQPKQSDKYYGPKMNTWLINQAKWAAAKEFCETNGAQFSILTEKVLK